MVGNKDSVVEEEDGWTRVGNKDKATHKQLPVDDSVNTLDDWLQRQSMSPAVYFVQPIRSNQLLRYRVSLSISVRQRQQREDGPHAESVHAQLERAKSSVARRVYTRLKSYSEEILVSAPPCNMEAFRFGLDLVRIVQARICCLPKP